MFCREIYPWKKTKCEITEKFKIYIGIFYSKGSWKVALKIFFSELISHKIKFLFDFQMKVST